MEFFITHDFWFVPLITLLIILLLGLGIGFINGWKTSLYFFVWNFIALIISVFTIKALAGRLTGFVNDLINSNVDPANPIDVSAVAALAESLIITVGIVGVLLVINMLALIIYFFFRKKLKKEIKENKAANKSNLLARVVGSGVGFFTAMPIASGLAATSTIISNNQGVNKVVDNFMFLSSFGQVKHVSQDFDTIVGMASFAVSSVELINILNDLNSGTLTETQAKEFFKDNKTSFEYALADQNTIDLAKDIVSQNNPNVDLSTVDTSIISGYINPEDRFYVPNNNINDVKEIIALLDGPDGLDSTDSKINEIFDALFRTS